MALTKGIVSGGNYTFSAANRTITFSSDYIGMSLSDVTYITNIKSGVATVIYDPFDATKGGVLNGLVLTLAYNTTSMGDTDPLQIIVGFTPLNSDPTPVRIVEGSDQKDDTELLNRIADGVDFLNLSLDQTEGIQVNIRDANPARRDVNNAQVISDGVQYTFTLSSLNGVATVDTSGYQSVEFFMFGLTGANLSGVIEVSPDGVNWSGPPYFELGTTTATGVANSGLTIAQGNTRRFVVSAISKFARLRIGTYTAGSVLVIATLKQTPLPTGPYQNLPVNIITYGGTTVATAQQVDAAGNLASAGNFAVGSSYVGTTNRPNAASTLATGVPYPHAIGGREQPYIGALAGVFRHITVDGGGRYILGGDTPDTETRFQSKLASGAIPGIPPRGVAGIPNNMVGAQSLTVADVSQDFGDTHIMLLRQILTELKILNQQFVEMPQMLNQANFTMSDPQEYRNNGDFDSSIQ